MRRLALSVAVLVAVSLSMGVAQAVVVIDTVPVGNTGNTDDTHGTGYGGVDYAYNIGKYEVTNAEYAEFLNNVAATDTHGLYNTSMGSGYGGITRSGGAGSYTYNAITGRGSMPVNYVSFWDACRFANWLHNGQGTGDTETGAYTLTTDGITNNTVARNADWQWAVTSEDEWYKAAYHDGSDAYYDYPTQSNIAPTAEGPAGTNSTNGSANYYWAVADLTDVGAYTYKPSDSPYGTFDQGGNVWEWNEAITSTSYRGLRGASFFNTGGLDASSRDGYDATVEDYVIGFRVASIPEPSTAVLGIVGLLGLAFYGWRRRR